jgi:hypothetical protein
VGGIDQTPGSRGGWLTYTSNRVSVPDAAGKGAAARRVGALTCASFSSRLLTPSPPAEKTTDCQDHARQTDTPLSTKAALNGPWRVMSVPIRSQSGSIPPLLASRVQL